MQQHKTQNQGVLKKKMPKIDTLDALDDEITSILNNSEDTLNTL